MRGVEFQEYATIGVDLERRSQEDSIGMMRRMSVFVSKSGHVNYGSQCPKMALAAAPKVPPAACSADNASKLARGIVTATEPIPWIGTRY